MQRKKRGKKKAANLKRKNKSNQKEKMRKACKRCRMLFSEEKCPICNNTDFTETWKGKIIVLKPAESEISKKMVIEKEGVYAIKIK